ncbi:F-box/SPRY domain-containing protein 1 [Aphelenchoides bicaudatus]|nr:F-box/SPRY domain-containing protein 1 [Aphelenchoides bicaudatus]
MTNQKPAVSAARLPTRILLPVFKNLTLKDINACLRVCRHWNTVIESSGKQLWLPLAKKEIPESGLNDAELFSKSMSYKHRLRAFRFAFNPEDASRHTFIKTNGFTVHRQPVAQSTDAIRGKIGVTSGVHSFQVTWKGPLGTVAVVGIATKHAALHCPGYVALLGSDDQSWGFNLVDNSLLHNGALVGQYPRINNPPKYQVGDKLTMILNKDQNILYFEKGGEFLGKMATKVVKGKKLAPKVIHNTYLSVAIRAQMASAAPPLGTQLGQRGVNVQNFCKDFNARTEHIKPGALLPTRIDIKPDRTYDLEICSPMSTWLLKRAAGINRGGDTAQDIAGKLSVKHIYEIAKVKSKDRTLVGIPLRDIVHALLITARSVGIKVQNEDLDPVELKEFLDNRREVVAAKLKAFADLKASKMLRST